MISFGGQFRQSTTTGERRVGHWSHDENTAPGKAALVNQIEPQADRDARTLRMERP